MAGLAIIPLGNPAAIWFSLAALPVIGAFFFRYRSRVHEIPALLNWVIIGRPIDVRSTAALLRRLLSLLAQIVLIGLLVFCLVNPFPRPPIAHRVAIVIDSSATMQTTEVGESRLDLALDKARAIMRRLAPDTQLYLVTAGSRPISVYNDKISFASPLPALDAIRAGDTRGDIPAAIRAISFLSADPDARAFVISDFAGNTSPSAFSNLWHGPAALSLIPIGTDHPDCAITGSWAEPVRNGWKIIATFTNRGLVGRTAIARLISNKQTIAQKPVPLAAAPARVEFDVDLSAGTAYEIILDAGDALAVDDRAFGVLPSRPVICLVTHGDAPLQRAILANSAAELRVVRHNQYNGPGDANVLIVDGPGLRSDARGMLRGCLCIGTGDPFGFVIGGTKNNVTAVTHWQGDHPSLSEVDPATIQFHSAFALSPAGQNNLVPLLSAAQTPLIEERSSADSNSLRIVYWAFNLSDTDLPSRLTFPVLLWDTIDYLSAGVNESQHMTGQPLVLQNTIAPQILGPDDHPLSVRPIYSGYTATNTDKQGIYVIHTTGPDKLVAINLLSARATLPLPRDKPSSNTSPAATPSIQPSVLSWRTLLIAAMVCAAVEWLLFHLRLVRIG